LAHSKSALKRWRQSLVARDRNRAIKSRTRTLFSKALMSIGDDATSAEDSVKAAISGLDRAAKQGVIHPNAAARSKSRLLKRFNHATANAVAAAASAPAAEAEKPAPRARRAAAPKAAEKPAPRATRGKAADEKPAPRGRAKKS
jgi:small subunit ribosomal protein S20